MRTIALSAARLTRGLGSRAASANRGKAASILWRPQTFDAILNIRFSERHEYCG